MRNKKIFNSHTQSQTNEQMENSDTKLHTTMTRLADISKYEKSLSLYERLENDANFSSSACYTSSNKEQP